MNRRRLAVALAGVVSLIAGGRDALAISIASFGAPLTEDFSTLSSSAPSSLVPFDWFFAESGTNADGLYTPGSGTSNAGDTYSYGASLAPDRALGSLRSGTLSPLFGVMFTNDVAGGVIASLEISFRGEQWRLGTASRTDQLDFQYSLDAVSLTSGTWTDVNGLDFVTPDFLGTAGARDGNQVFTALGQTISSLSIPEGASIWMRWMDADVSGADDGLAVDDFSLTAHGTVVPEPSAALLLGMGCMLLSGSRRRRGALAVA